MKNNFEGCLFFETSLDYQNSQVFLFAAYFKKEKQFQTNCGSLSLACSLKLLKGIKIASEQEFLFAAYSKPTK